MCLLTRCIYVVETTDIVLVLHNKKTKTNGPVTFVVKFIRDLCKFSDFLTVSTCLPLKFLSFSSHTTVKHNIVFCQPKAWMDRVRLMAYYKVLVKPWMERNGFAKSLPLHDQCSCHMNDQVVAFAKSLGIHSYPLIERCTHILQIIDLIFNGPYKAESRAARIEPIFHAFQAYTTAVGFAFVKELPPPPAFKVPMRRPIDAVRLAQDFVDKKRRDPYFVETIKRMWVKMGFLPNAEGGYNP